MNYYTHNLNPVAFEIMDTPIAWYWLVYVLGFFLVFAVCCGLIKKYDFGIGKKELADTMTLGWLFLLLFARAGYILFYNLDYFLKNPDQIFSIWNGGMAFHGALIGVIISLMISSRLTKQTFFNLTDLFVLPMPFLFGLGRVANFVNGELVGRPTNGSWGFIFPSVDNIPRHPSQLYQAASEGFLLFLILLIFRDRLLKYQGMMSGVFLAGYGLMRFFAEFFREPDPQVGYQLFELTRGQHLCIVMTLAGLTICWYAQTKKTERAVL